MQVLFLLESDEDPSIKGSNLVTEYHCLIPLFVYHFMLVVRGNKLDDYWKCMRFFPVISFG